MADTSVIPSSFKDVSALARPDTSESLEPGQVQGVIFTMAAEDCIPYFQQLERWFAGRDEVSWVETGVSEKQETGYIILEWDEVEIDPLFLAILREDESILDYLLYLREKEV